MTASEEACRQALRTASGTEEGPIERHSRRVLLLAERLAGDRPYDHEVLACACWLHDIGLYPAAPTKDAYVTDGRHVAEELLAGWEPERLRLCADAVEFHHTLRSQAARGLEVELVRQADLVEVSQGLLRAGLPRAFVRSVRREVRVRGFLPEVLRRLGHSALHRPASLPRIFFPRRSGG